MIQTAAVPKPLQQLCSAAVWIDIITNATQDNPKILTFSRLPRIHGTQKRGDGERLCTDDREG